MTNKQIATLVRSHDRYALMSNEKLVEGDYYATPHNVDGHKLSEKLIFSRADKNFMTNHYIENIDAYRKVLAVSDTIFGMTPAISINFGDFAYLNSQTASRIDAMSMSYVLKEGNPSKDSLQKLQAAWLSGFETLAKSNTDQFNIVANKIEEQLKQITEWQNLTDSPLVDAAVNALTELTELRQQIQQVSNAFKNEWRVVIIEDIAAYKIVGLVNDRAINIGDKVRLLGKANVYTIDEIIYSEIREIDLFAFTDEHGDKRYEPQESLEMLTPTNKKS